MNDQRADPEVLLDDYETEQVSSSAALGAVGFEVVEAEDGIAVPGPLLLRCPTLSHLARFSCTSSEPPEIFAARAIGYRWQRPDESERCEARGKRRSHDNRPFDRCSARPTGFGNQDAFLTELRVARTRAVDGAPEHAREREQEQS